MVHHIINQVLTKVIPTSMLLFATNRGVACLAHRPTHSIKSNSLSKFDSLFPRAFQQEPTYKNKHCGVSLKGRLRKGAGGEKVAQKDGEKSATQTHPTSAAYETSSLSLDRLPNRAQTLSPPKTPPSEREPECRILSYFGTQQSGGRASPRFATPRLTGQDANCCAVGPPGLIVDMGGKTLRLAQ